MDYEWQWRFLYDMRYGKLFYLITLYKMSENHDFEEVKIIANQKEVIEKEEYITEDTNKNIAEIFEEEFFKVIKSDVI